MHYKRCKEIEDVNSFYTFFKLLGKAYINVYPLHMYLLTTTSKIGTAGGQSPWPSRLKDRPLQVPPHPTTDAFL